MDIKVASECKEHLSDVEESPVKKFNSPVQEPDAPIFKSCKPAPRRQATSNQETII